jgi:hypothetical protein
MPRFSSTSFCAVALLSAITFLFGCSGNQGSSGGSASTPGTPLITKQPTDTTRFVGESATFSVNATGMDASYQWYRNSGPIAGANSASYTTPTLLGTDDAAVYNVIVTNGAGSIVSSKATLRVGPFATVFTTQKNVKLNMFAWPGANNAFLTKTSAYSPIYIRKILDAADSTYNYYATTVGAKPSLLSNYNGLATIANTGIAGIDLCGLGCTYIGNTGMEIDDSTTSDLYQGVQVNTYNWVIFYEFGRSFWLFGSKLDYKPRDYSICQTTGFAVYMGIHSIQAQNLQSNYGFDVPNNPDPFKDERLALDSYASDPHLNFKNTFQTSTLVNQYGYGDCPVLWAGLVDRLYVNYGGEPFIQALFKEVLKRPDAETTQDAADNFILAASAAAGKNLTYTFGTTWKWPVSEAASQEAQNKWGPPI